MSQICSKEFVLFKINIIVLSALIFPLVTAHVLIKSQDENIIQTIPNVDFK